MQPGNGTKVLVVGLDSADPGILRRMADEGSLPTVSALLRQSACATTINPEGIYVGALWASFATGMSPGRHGRHSPRQLVPGTYIARPLAPEETRWDPFWAQLGREGRHIAVVDVPHTHPIADAGGIQVSEWGAHDPWNGLATWPTDLGADLVERFGQHPVHPSERIQCDDHEARLDDYLVLRDALVAGVERKGELVCHLLDQGPWDLFLTVFSEAHCANHQCWHLHDSTHPRHDAEMAHMTGDVIETVYIALDHALARVLEHVSDDTTVFVLASHGAGPHYDASFMFDRILRAIELTELSPARRAVRRTMAWTWDRLPYRVQYRHRHRRDRLWRGFEELSPLNPASRRYFKIDNNEPFGGVRINVIGREPAGKVRRGSEFDECCEQLSRDLLEFINLETRRPLARRIVRTDSLYEGESLDMLPDLLVEWENDVPVRSVWSPKTGQIDAEYTYIRTGDHRPAGMVLARGPRIQPGARDPIRITDLAPTITALLDTRLETCDGQIVSSLLPDRPA
jgi:predicted AlkP superfamily phosphohydrolase/phosphomutase